MKYGVAEFSHSHTLTLELFIIQFQLAQIHSEMQDLFHASTCSISASDF